MRSLNEPAKREEGIQGAEESDSQASIQRCDIQLQEGFKKTDEEAKCRGSELTEEEETALLMLENAASI